MNRIVFGSLAAAAVAGLAFGVANADSRGAGPMGGMGERPSFTELDADGDGSITIAEVKARSAAHFAESDTNGDGKLSADELTAAVAARAAERAAAGMARMIEWRDTDGDGMLSEAEMSDTAGSRMFARLDANDDGVISAEEFAAMEGRGGRNQRGDRRGMHGDRG